MLALDGVPDQATSAFDESYLVRKAALQQDTDAKVSGHVGHCDQRHVFRDAKVHVSYRRRLFAGGAGVHVDFHADRYFDDLGGLPGHFVSLVKNRMNFTSVTGADADQASAAVLNVNCADQIAETTQLLRQDRTAGDDGRGCQHRCCGEAQKWDRSEHRPCRCLANHRRRSLVTILRAMALAPHC